MMTLPDKSRRISVVSEFGAALNLRLNYRARGTTLQQLNQNSTRTSGAERLRRRSEAMARHVDLDGAGDGLPKPATIWYPQHMNVRFTNRDRLFPGFVAASFLAPVPRMC